MPREDERSENDKRPEERWRCDVCCTRNGPHEGSCTSCRAERGSTFVGIFGAFGDSDKLAKYIADLDAARTASAESRRSSSRVPRGACVSATRRRTLQLRPRSDEDEDEDEESKGEVEVQLNGSAAAHAGPVLGRTFDDPPDDPKHLARRRQEVRARNNSDVPRVRSGMEQRATSVIATRPRPLQLRPSVDEDVDEESKENEGRTVAERRRHEVQPATNTVRHHDRSWRAKRCRQMLEEAASEFAKALPLVVDLTADSSDEPAENDGHVGRDDRSHLESSVESPGENEQAGGDASDEEGRFWKCDICFDYNPPTSASCRACATPFGIPFDEEFLREQAAQKLVPKEDSSTPTAKESAAATRVERKCDVCRHDITESSDVCVNCGTEYRDIPDDGEREQKHPTKQPAPLPQRQPTIAVAAKRKKQQHRPRASSPPVKLTSSRLRKPRELVTSRVSPAPPPRLRPQFLDTPWPFAIASLRHMFNPEGVRFGFESPFAGVCQCSAPCRVDTCRNAKLGVFCRPNCCEYGGDCGNTINESVDLQLVRRRRTRDFSVLASAPIDAWVIIGEYLGQVCVGEEEDQDQQPAPQNEYKFKMKREARSHQRKNIYIDAAHCGSVTRFLNHSCSPATAFYEVRNGCDHTVVVVTTRAIDAGEEITVNYGKNLWFTCTCGVPSCCHKHLQHPTE